MLIHTLKLLNIAWKINVDVKENAYCYYEQYDYYIVDYKLRNKEYSKKTGILKQIIKNIKENQLPIKYGKKDGVIYFMFNNKQVSFHDPANQIQCKLYRGKWSEIKNMKPPFKFTNQKKLTK